MKRFVLLLLACLVASPSWGATHALTFETTTGQTTLYAFPVGVSLATWNTNRVLLVEASSPNTGQYTFTLDDSSGTRLRWKIFDGASQPASWDLYVASIDLTVKAKTDNLPSDPADQSVLAGLLATIDSVVDEILAVVESLEPSTDSRDLSPPDVALKLPARTTGRAYVANPGLRLVPGESFKAGFDCEGTIICSNGAVLETMEEPTGLSDDLSATRIGHGGRYANFTAAAAADAEVGTVQWCEVEVTNDRGSTFFLVTKVEVIAAHPE